MSLVTVYKFHIVTHQCISFIARLLLHISPQDITLSLKDMFDVTGPILYH